MYMFEVCLCVLVLKCMSEGNLCLCVVVGRVYLGEMNAPCWRKYVWGFCVFASLYS